MRMAASHVDELAERLVRFGVKRLALAGGLAPHMARWVSARTRSHLVPQAGDALDGAIRLARFAAETITA